MIRENKERKHREIKEKTGKTQERMNQVTKFSLPAAYTLLQEKNLPEVNGQGYLLEHKKTGAVILVVVNDDPDKVFTIGFRTPPENSHGVQHIIEHTVLCGSRKYPVKDPFIELAKGSLNTFLNAMTYGDKTVYPVASVNDQDYKNLTDVYLDAVFHPNIYKYPEIFQQEGWHYELEDRNAPLTVNGVVYNEMRGVYSSDESILSYGVNQALFPDTIYSLDSGGDPAVIPDLSREEYLNYHRNYYHPSNSYIYFYGNIDPAERLDYLDREYLSQYERKEIHSEIPLQKPFDKPVYLVKKYAAPEGETTDKGTFLSCNTVVGTSRDRNIAYACDILGYVLADVPDAPLKKALIDAGIGSDVTCSIDTSLQQPVFSIMVRNASPEDEGRFREIIDEVLKDQIENGIDRKTLAAAINHDEFQHKEGNFGRTPRGLALGLNAFETWLYDKQDCFDAFGTQHYYDEMKEKQDTGWFEEILRKYVLENNHKAYVSCVPEQGLNKRADDALAERLAVFKASLTPEQLDSIISDTAHLKEYQSTPSSPEDLAKIPLLKISDIDPEALKLKNVERQIAGATVVWNPIFTNGISYLRFVFPANDFTLPELQTLMLYTEILQEVKTEHYSAAELSNICDTLTGGIGFDIVCGWLPGNDAQRQLFAYVKTFDDKTGDGIRLISEIMGTSDITNKKKLREIISEIHAGGRSDLTENGHLTAYQLACSYISPSQKLADGVKGIGYYDWISDLDAHFEDRYEKLAADLKAVQRKILRKQGFVVSFTSETDPESLAEPLESFLSQLSDTPAGEQAPVTLEKKNEGVRTATKVQYVAVTGDYSRKGLPYTGALDVLQVIFSYDYLWNNLRVLGGAYGCMFRYGRSGLIGMVSYRDPHLQRTMDVYRKASEYVRQFHCSDRDFTKYIIGAVAKLDAPLTPQSEGAVSFAFWQMGLKDADLQKEKDEVLGCTQEKIRQLYPYIDAITEADALAVVGSREKIDGAEQLFGSVRDLI